MIVCECTGTTAKKIRNLTREGATSVAEITRLCGAGGCCQSCRPLISRIVKATLAESATPLPASDSVAEAATA